MAADTCVGPGPRSGEHDPPAPKTPLTGSGILGLAQGEHRVEVHHLSFRIVGLRGRAGHPVPRSRSSRRWHNTGEPWPETGCSAPGKAAEISAWPGFDRGWLSCIALPCGLCSSSV